MTTPKPPSIPPVTDQESRCTNPVTAGCTPPILQLPCPDEQHPKPPVLIRYANSAQGALAQRNLGALRRFLLDARDPLEQRRRQSDLFVQSTACLSLERSSKRVVQAALLAWPVSFCMSGPLRVRSYIQFGLPESAGLKAELARAWAATFDLAESDVEIHGLVDARQLAGIDPLALQSFTGKEVNRWSRLQPNEVASDPVPLQLGHCKDGHADDSGGARGAAEMVSVGRNLPATFLLLAFVRWEPREVPPAVTDNLAHSTARLQNLLQALFTHSNPGWTESASVTSPSVIRSEVRLGKPQHLHEAMTQAQSMQMAWMAERARKTDCCFDLEHRQVGSLMAWSATLTDILDEVIAKLDYSYDGFWRPQCHVQYITEQVSLAQATGQMCTESPNPLTH